ncbi:MAG: low specificity L-threonine aldolase [Firmicutes bacterium]|nr:low specificity L-threonine aldolase [Bacillota bacterium]
MIRFECDYSEGAHPEVLRRLQETNLEQTPGYGEDCHCANAAAMIKKLCGREDIAVHFLVGGTQTNTTVIKAALRPHQGVISPVSGHINVHESGAIEATGHKVLALPSHDGKITAEQIKRAWREHWEDATHEHMVQPGMVYISNSTESGLIYTLSELTAISEVCRECGLLLYVDGARLGYAMAAPGNDITFADMARLTDALYIGGTKQGALFGEALVISNPALNKDFRYLIKQQGGMLAKGRLLGIQFEALLENDLYGQLSRKAVGQALRIMAAFAGKGYPQLFKSYTNQQFPILPDEKLKKLAEKYAFSYWQRVDENHSAVRFCTGWATTEEQVSQLIADIEAL